MCSMGLRQAPQWVLVCRSSWHLPTWAASGGAPSGRPREDLLPAPLASTTEGSWFSPSLSFYLLFCMFFV